MSEIEALHDAARPHLLPVLVDAQPNSSGAVIRPISDLVDAAESQLNDAEQSGTDAEAAQAVGAFSAAYDRLGIVNPDKRKFATTVLNETYYELIRRFANELEKENSVLFAHGFSFRDEHLRDLVLRAARTNPTLQVIVFCYSRDSAAAFEILLPETEIKNGNIQLVTPAEPSADEPERKISLDVLESDFFAPLIRDKVPTPDQRIELDIRTSSEPASD